MDVIFDIDGTLLDISHRLKFIKQTPKDWKSFRDPKQKQWDEPRLEIIRIATALQDAGHQLIFASGRTESERSDTIISLRSWFLLDGWTDIEPYNIMVWDDAVMNDVSTSPFYMRKNNDYRADTIVKGEMFDQMLADGYEPTLVFDDRPSVIRMWRELGSLTVIDVGHGIEF